MPLYRIQTSLKSKSGLPEDDVVNSLYVEGPAPGDNDAHDLAIAMRDFYNAVPAGQAFAVSTLLSANLAETGHHTKVYRLDDPKPRAPLYDLTWDFTSAPNASSLPGEVAVCLSFKAAPVSGAIAARRRGRIFISPLATSVATPGTAQEARPEATRMARLRAAAFSFKAAVNALGFVWVVHSPTTGALARYPVALVWTDDAFDTQRRRGVRPTAKTQLAITQISLAA